MASEIACQAYLISPPLDKAGVGAFASMLEAALRAGPVASLLARVASDAQGDAKAILHTLAPLTAAAGVALLVENDARLAARAGADGAHVAGAGGNLADALASLKPERIVGAGLLRGRDDAMAAGEAGADYVMFGEPRPDGYTPPLEETIERVAWWAAIFEPPCVGYAAGVDDVARLVAAGADFVALGGAIWDAASPAQALAQALGAMEAR